MAMTLEELRRKAGTSAPGTQPAQAKSQLPAPTMTLDELRKKAGTTAPVRPARVQPQTSQPAQTAGEVSPAVSYADKAKQEKGWMDTVGAFGEATLEGLRGAGENIYGTMQFGTVGNIREADMAKRLQGIDITNPQAISDAMKTNYQQAGIESEYAKQIGREIAQRQQAQGQRIADIQRKYEGAPLVDIAVNAGQGVGNMIPAIAIGGVSAPALGTAAFATNVFGSSAGEALNNGASLSQAGQYATASAVLETAVESVFGGIPNIGDGILNPETYVKKFTKSAMGRLLANRVADIMGEGVEEAVSEVIQPFLVRAFYDENADDASIWDALYAAGNGALVAAILGIANVPGTVGEYRQNKADIAEENAVKDKATELKMDEKSANKLTETFGEQTAGAFVQNNIDADFSMENGRYVMHKDGQTVPVTKEMFDYSQRLKAEPYKKTAVQIENNTAGINQVAEENVKPFDVSKLPQATEQPKTKLSEYTATLGDNKSKAEHQLNKVRGDTKTTNAQFIEDNLDAGFVQEGNHYFLEKDGRKTSITKAAYDYANYLLEQDEAQAAQTMPQAEIAKDINVPDKAGSDINVGATEQNIVNNAPTETAKEETKRIIATESNPARKALHRKKLVDMGKEGVAKYLDDFEKRTGIKVYLFDGSDYSWGFQKGKAIYLNIESPDIVLQTKVHESIHVYKKNNEKKFKFLRKNALKLEDYSRPNKFGRAAYDVRETYADDPDVDEEVVARLCELCLDDPEAFLDKVNRDKTIIEAVVDILKYIKNTLTTILSKDEAKVEQAKIDNTLFALERLLRSDVGEIGTEIKLSQKENKYMQLAQNPQANEAELQKMVEQAAREAGYDSPLLYHGTENFGFTEIDLSYSDDGISFFATDSLETASTYSTTDEETKISSYKEIDVEEVLNEIDRKTLDFAESVNRAAGVYNFIDYRECSMAINGFADDLYNGSSAWIDAKDDFDDYLNSVVDSLYEDQEFYNEDFDVDEFFVSPEVQEIIKIAQEIEEHFKEIVKYNEGGAGNYKLYANTEGMLEIDAKDSRWNAIPVPESINQDGTATTRQLARYAKGEGYTGVKVSNVYDDGGRGFHRQRKPATVYIFFNPQAQVKSADPVTYDNDGNIIPLEERFNTKNPDIRFSKKTESKKMEHNAVYKSYDGFKRIDAKPYDDSKSIGIDGIKHSLKSARYDFIDDGQIMDDLVNYGIFDEKEAKQFRSNIEKVLNKVLMHPRALDMNEEYSKGNRPYTSFKPNSDPLYKISLDFSTMCKKRLMTQYLIEALQTKLAEADPDTKAISAEETLAIRERLLQLKEEYKDIEVACGLCYVEAARLKGPKQINAFLDKAGREKILRKHFAKQNAEFEKSIKDFKSRAKVEAGYDADRPLNSLPGKVKTRIDNNVKMQRERYTPSAEEQAIIDRALKLDNIQFLTVDNLTRLSVEEPEIYKAFTSHVRSSTRSKTVESGVPYYYGDASEQGLTDSLIEAMNKENGLRHQSWSDFETVHLLDTITAVCELSIRGAKMHAYTKVPNFIRLVGDTGMMINISLIPEGETGIHNGKLVYSPIEGMDYEIAKQLRDEHPQTSGTICIGINDKQITMMLDDDTIDYVIPYHASGMNKKLRGMAKVSGWTDYQDKQSEKYLAGAVNKDNNPDWHKKPDFSDWFNEAEIDTSRDGVEIMREAAERYKQLCAERGLKPKFADFVNHPNYWKLLIDRKMVNHKTGEIIIQKPVRPNFDFDVIDAILSEEVRKYDSDLKKTLSEELYKSWNDGTIKAIEKTLVANEAANARKRNSIKKGKLTGQDAMTLASVLGENAVLNMDNIVDNSVYGKLLKFDTKQSRKSKRTAIPEEYIGKSVSEVKQLIADKHKAKSTTVNAVGATKANPKNITHMVNEYGEMKPGEKPERFISMPVSTDGNDRVGKFARTAAESGVTSEKMVEAIEKAVARGDFSHEIWRDKTAINDAVAYIEKYGYGATLGEFYKRVDNKGQVTKGDMTKAMTMYAVAVENNNIETALKLAVKINKAAVNAGQVVQSVRILKKSSPEGRLFFAQKSLEAYQDEVNEKYGSKAPELVVDDSILKALKDARTEEEIKKATTELHQVIADQLPFSWSNFITSWRYLAMLGNPRTQVRNVISNTVNSVASEYVNWIQAGIEKSTRMSTSTTTDKPTQKQIDYAKLDYQIVKEQLSGEGKYRDNSLNSIERMKNPFSFPTFWGKEGDQFVGWRGNVRKYGEPLMKGLTKWNELTNTAMEKGDLIFSEKAYVKAFARYLKANNIDPAKITGEEKLDARAWATRQALESVFRENNQLANRISRLERNLVNSNSKGGKVGAVVIGGLMPFKSTPLNITKRAFEYTPLGIIKGVADIKTNEKVYMPAAINDIAKGLSGTSLIILGAALAKYGLLKGGLGDDKEDKMAKQMGQQSYSIDTPWFSYTLDWGGAALMPLFVGADIYESNSEDDSWLMNIVNALANAGSPIIETSMMTGMMDAIQSMSYEDVATEKLVAGLSSAMANYLGQFVPTLFGQVARAVDDTSRSSYTDVKGALKPLAKTAQKAQNKIPFLSKTNVPYMDVWGNDEKNFGGNVVGRLAYNMLSPGYVSTKSNDKVEKMLADLYDKTGETSVLPSNYTTSKKVNGENIRFTDKQFEKYTKEYGQTAYDRLDNLFSDKRFDSLTDKEKVKAIEDIYDYSREMASNETVEYRLANTDKNKKAAIGIGVPAYDVFAGGTIADKDGNSNDAVTEAEAISYINKYGKSLTKEQKAVLYKVVGTDKGYTDAENKTYVNTYADTIKNISSGMSEAKVREIYESAHEYARAIAKVKAGVDDSTKTLENKEKALSAGVSPYYIFAGKQKADTLGNENGYTSKDEVISYIESLGLSSTEKAYLFAALGNSNWKNPYV